MSTEHTPLPWKRYYDNDTGPNDESFLEWIQVGPAKIALPRHDLKARTQAETDADLVLHSVNSYGALVKALEAYDKAAIALTDQQLIDNQPLMAAIAQGREALTAAGKGK